MSNMELEVKILNINKKDIINKIKKAGGKYISSAEQYLYVYDLMYINQRFYSNLYELNNEAIELRKNIALDKIKNIFQEIDQLIDNDEINFLKNNFQSNNLVSLFNFDREKVLKILNSKEIKELIDKYKSTPKKWIRLRKTVEKNENNEIKEKTTLTVKHILRDNKSSIQQMQETEIIVDSFEETNELLEKLGFSYRGYQEKKRKKYILNDHEIDIDTWPGLSPYIELEGKDEKDIESILDILGYTIKDTVSCTVDEIYKNINLDINNMKELKF